MSSEKRKYISNQKKVEILRKLSRADAKMSGICEEYGVQPSAVYKWQDQLFSRAHELFDNSRGRKPVDRSLEKIADLEGRLAKRDSVIAELLQDHCELKKSLGVL
ncbi:MAG: transposase [Nitrospina sp.]|jgi:transposase-like protein|nr:transposase [Nitrospina sp.]